MKSEIANLKSEIRTGTREWSDVSINCCLGCKHGCLYCYARTQALKAWPNASRPGRIASGLDWTAEWPLTAGQIAASRKFGRRHDGVVMFPTTHDITPGNADACLAVLSRLLKAGNRVLLVSKPHLAIMRRIIAVWREQCDANLCPKNAAVGATLDKFCGQCSSPEIRVCPRARNQADSRLEIRCTIGAMDDGLLAFWEPGAPCFRERLAGLRLAYEAGLSTSVSCEPLLEPVNAAALVEAVSPYVSGEIWIGKANQLRFRTAWISIAREDRGPKTEDRRPLPGEATLEAEIRWLEEWQTDARVMEIYSELYTNPKVRWKDSYRRVIERFGTKS